MIMDFPAAHENELLGSVLARFIDRHGLRDDKVALDILFGSRNIVPSALLQGHINVLLERVGHLWSISSEEVISQHTILPVYQSFIEPERYQNLYAELAGSVKSHSMLRVGINASSLVFNRYYRYCPVCLREDFQKYAYSYWRRHFQLPGVLVCPKHCCLLMESPYELKPSRRHMFVNASDSVMFNSSSMVVVCESKPLIQLSKSITGLLNSNMAYITPNQWSMFYGRLLVEAGLKESRGVQHNEIKYRIEQFWGKEQLGRFGLNIVGDTSWLHSFFRKQRKHFTYLHHLVCLQALFPNYSLKEAIIQASNVRVNFNRKQYFSSNAEKRAEEYRSIWNGLCLKFTVLKEIRSTKEGARVYSWLYRFDNAWLSKNLPKRFQNRISSLVDWPKRDRRLVKLLLEIMHRVEDDLYLPRKSTSWFVNQTGESWGIQKHLGKLPLCYSFFSKYSETIEEYQIRRVLAIIVDAINCKEAIPKAYEIERLAGLSKARIREPARIIIRDYVSILSTRTIFREKLKDPKYSWGRKI